MQKEGELLVVGLALGAGGTKGWAHAGVIRVLREAGVPIDIVCGASAGALIGPLYAATQDAGSAEDIALSFTPGEFSEWFLKGLRLAPDAGRMGRRLWQAYGHLGFEALAIPFAAVAHDLRTGGRLTLREGLVATAVEASIRPPFIGAPTRWNGRALVDGGFHTAVPTDVAREMGATFVIGVSVGAFIRLPQPLRPYSAMFARALRGKSPAEHCIEGQLAFMAELMSHERERGPRPDVAVRPDMTGISASLPGTRAWRSGAARRRR